MCSEIKWDIIDRIWNKTYMHREMKTACDRNNNVDLRSCQKRHLKVGIVVEGRGLKVAQRLMRSLIH